MLMTHHDTTGMTRLQLIEHEVRQIMIAGILTQDRFYVSWADIQKLRQALALPVDDNPAPPKTLLDAVMACNALDMGDVVEIPLKQWEAVDEIASAIFTKDGKLFDEINKNNVATTDIHDQAKAWLAAYKKRYSIMRWHPSEHEQQAHELLSKIFNGENYE